ncbi:hypothetical protein F2P79_025813 [Pimephales promelas]|nr:hypothetical protein F2P79_025813 [Pimephales promelas]
MPQSPCLNRPQPAKEPLPQTTAWLQKGCNKANQKGPKIHSGPCIYPRHADKTFTCKLSNQHDCMKQILLDMDYVQSRGAQLPRSSNRDCQNGLPAVAISFDRLTPDPESDQGLSPPWTSSKTDLKLHRLRQAYFEKQTISQPATQNGPPSTKRLKPNQPRAVPSQHATGKHKSEHTSDNNSAATSQTAEILKVLKAFLHEASQGDKSDILCLSARPKPDTQNTACQHQTTELTVASQSDNTKQPLQLTAAQPEHDSPVSHKTPALTAHRSQHQPRCLNFWEP